MKKPVEVMIMGHRLTVTSDDGEDHVREIAAEVDRQMRQLAEGRTPSTVVQLALLTAMNMTSDYQKLNLEREELHRVIDRLSNRVSQLKTGTQTANESENSAPASDSTVSLETTSE